MEKKIPSYLLEKNQLIGSVVFSVFFAIVFLNIYTPFSSTAWFDMSKSVFFVYTIAVIAIATSIIVISRTILYKMRNKIRLNYLQYGIWMIAEVVIIAMFYSFITWRYINQSEKGFFEIMSKSILYTSLILVIPYSIAILYCALDDRNKTLRLLRYGNVVSDGEDHPLDSELIHLTDNNGNLRLSIKLENLYYIESQDNYIKVYYMNKGLLSNYMLRCKLKTIEDSFIDSPLVRCHRSYIINTSKVKILRKEKEGLLVDMDCRGINAIPVSKSYSDNVLRKFSNRSNVYN